MPSQRDVVIIGGGHNGLVTAYYLAKAGMKPLVLERRPQAGGAAVTEEFHPGFRCSTLSHAAGPLRPEVAADMQLARHGPGCYSSPFSSRQNNAPVIDTEVRPTCQGRAP